MLFGRIYVVFDIEVCYNIPIAGLLKGEKV